MDHSSLYRRQAGSAATNLLGLLVLIAVVAGAYWFFTAEEQPAPQNSLAIPSLEPATPPQPTDAIAEAPDIPALPLEEELAMAETPAIAATLPALVDSDGLVRDQVAQLGGHELIGQWLQTDSLIPKTVAIIDGLARGGVARKLLPVDAPTPAFAAIRQDDGLFLDPRNYQRFDSLIQALTSIPPEALARTFHTLRPLLEQAYGDLGQPADRLDNSLIAAIDRMLATPAVTGPLPLVQQSVLYQFADPTLEALPAVQKQLIRLGPDNRARLLGYLGELRSALLQQSPST